VNNAVLFIWLFPGLLTINFIFITESHTSLVLLIASQVVCGERSEGENVKSRVFLLKVVLPSNN
jgi:hypothetical protein